MKQTRFLLLFICSLAGLSSQAQLLAPNQPEQDACGALELCGTSFFTPYSYQGEGQELDMPNTPCGSGEQSAVWLKLTVSTSGTMVFKIIPELTQDDYDFAVIEATNSNCSNLLQSQVVRCNFNNNQPVNNGGIVGLSMNSNYLYVQSGTTGQNYSRYIDAIAGQVYYIMINNFGVGGNPSSGFTVDFTGSTATFNAGGNPTLQNILTPICNNKNQITVQLSEEIKCNSIATNGSDFYVMPGGSIASASGVNCSGSNGYTDKVKINFNPPLAPGNYTINVQQGSDGNTLLDLCDNPLQVPASLSFVVPKLKDTVYMTKCPAQLPFVWNGINVTAGGATAATYTVVNSMGCDSATVLNLTILPVLTGTVTLNKCSDDFPFMWNGITINAGGNAVATYQSLTPAGCDSVTTLNVNVIQPVFTTQNLTICVNQLPYNWNGIQVSAGGNAVANYTTNNMYGCDSTVTLNLVVTPIKQASQLLTKCSDDLPFVWNGITIPAGATTTDTIAQYMTQTASGCDSLTSLNLVVIPVNPLVVTVDTSACGSIIFNGVTYTQSTVVYDTLFNQYGCDSVQRTVNITVYPNEPYLQNINANGCLETFFEGVTYYNDTAWVDTFQNIHGCDSTIRNIIVYVEDFDLGLTTSHDTIAQGEYVVLTSLANVPYTVNSWAPNNLFIDQQAYQQTFKPDVTRNYEVIATSKIGCIDTATAMVVVDTLRPEYFMPNAFSPNGDGLNDLFNPVLYNKSGYHVEQFLIFDRWGRNVYTAVGRNNIGWNGAYGNDETKPCDGGVYYYIIQVKFVDGTNLTQKGDVTLIR